MSFIEHVGLLNGLTLESDADDAQLITGMVLIPNLLSIRRTNMSDQPKYTKEVNLFPLYDFQRGLLLSIEDKSMNDFSGDMLLKKALLSFRLHKSGNIFLAGIVRIYSGSRSYPFIPIIYGATIVIRNRYRFNINDIDDIRDICNKLNDESSIKPNIKIALERFDKSYLAMDEKDSVVDLCISYESLFSNLEKIRDHKGHAIGASCSMLIGKDSNNRDNIFNDIVNLFKIRNNIVHGSPINASEIHELRERAEEYLRDAIKKILKN